MAVTTWSFNSGFNGWTFEDVSAELSANPCPGCSSSRSHVAGAIRVQFILASLPNVTAAGENTIEDLEAAIQNGDTIEADYSATSDAKNELFRITAIYTDETTEFDEVVHSIAGTLTLTLTQNKTLDKIVILQGRSTSGSGVGSTHTTDIEEVRLTTAAALTPTSGRLRTPQSFIEGEGAGAAGGAGGGAGGNLADVSADGAYIYIATFNNLGFPELIRIPAPLNADGSVVFTPGAGGRIGVRCGRFNDDHVWIAGSFDGTDTIEKSEDSGGSWTVKDDGSFGTIRTFEVGPANDETVMVFDGDNSDIIETTDDGTTWTTRNAATAVLLNSLARLSVNPEEVGTTNEAGAANGTFYSVNNGVNLEDIDDGVYPNADGTKIIAT